MARKKAIDLEAYSMLDQYCIGLNEYYKSLRRAGFTPELALAILLEPLTYPATILGCVILAASSIFITVFALNSSSP